MYVKFTENLAHRHGYSVFAVQDKEGRIIEKAVGLIGFESEAALDQEFLTTDLKARYRICHQLFKKAICGGSLIAMGTPAVAKKTLIGIREYGDHLDFTILRDQFHTGLLITSKLKGKTADVLSRSDRNNN